MEAAAVFEGRTRRGHAFVLCLLVASTLGMAAELAGYLPHPFEYLSQWIYPWVLGAGFAGRMMDRPLTAAASGVVFLVTGLAANSLLKATAYGYSSTRLMAESEWPVWALLALVLGGTFGLMGWFSRGGSRHLAAIGGGALVGAGLAEAAVNVTGLLAWGWPIVLASGAAAMIVAVVIGWDWSAQERLIMIVSALTLSGGAVIVAPFLQSLAGVA